MSTIPDASCDLLLHVGALNPLHLAVLSLCCLGTTAIIAGAALLFVYRRRRS